MDQILSVEIDSLLKQRLPSKSVISGATLILANPENTQDLPLVMSNMYRVRLPKYNGFLGKSKGGVGAFKVFTLRSATNFICESFAAFRQLRILLNGTETNNAFRYDHYYAEWLKKKPIQWFNYDGGELGMTPNYGPLVSQAVAGPDGLFYATFVVPFPDNYSILTNKNHAIGPLKDLDIVIEFYLNNSNQFMSASGADAAINDGVMSNFGLYLPIVQVDNDVSNAVSAKLEMGDSDDNEMMLIAVEDVSTSQQTWDFGNPGTKTFIWNNVSSSVRFLEAKLSLEPTGGQAYKVSTACNPFVYQFQYIVDGKNVGSQNPITVREIVGANVTGGAVTSKINNYNLAYSLYQDLVSSYNQVTNDTQDMAPISKTVYIGVNNPAAAAGQANSLVFQQYPARTGGLTTSFVMPCNLDTVSKDLVGGVKLINNLALQLWYDGNPDGTAGGSVFQSCPLNCILIQHANRIIAFSKSKCKLIK